MNEEITDVGYLYFGLSVKTDGHKYYIGVSFPDYTDWEEIPKTLYDELIRLEEWQTENSYKHEAKKRADTAAKRETKADEKLASEARVVKAF